MTIDEMAKLLARECAVDVGSILAAQEVFPAGVNREYLVQEYREDNDVIRLSICRTRYSPMRGTWADRIEWDVLQAIKRELGYADCYAIEIYPRESDIVNDANMRHLWILPHPLPIGWFKDK